jgi:hypothetical protein
MKARLTRIEAKRRGKVFELGLGEVRVGRDPESDLVLEGVRISRLHAMIRSLGERHTLIDTNSSNGTTVNGVALKRAPVLLESNDLIEFSGEAAFIYETGSTVVTRRWSSAAAAMLTLLLIASGLALWQRVINDPVLDAAAELAVEAQEAGNEGDLMVAHTRLLEAARLLVRNGYLDHVERRDLMREAMNQLDRELGGDGELWRLLQRTQAAERDRAEAVLGPDLPKGPPHSEEGVEPAPAVP